MVGIGIYVLVQSKDWREAIETPDAGAILVILVGGITFLIAFFGCCGASQESQCMLSTVRNLIVLLADFFGY